MIFRAFRGTCCGAWSKEGLEIVETGGGEHAFGQSRVGGHEVGDASCTVTGRGDPDYAWENAALVLLDAGLVVAQVGVSFDEKSFGVLGVEVDLQPPVVLVPLHLGDDLKVGLDPLGVAVYSEVAAPAQGFGVDAQESHASSLTGFLGQDPRLHHSQGVREEPGGGLGVAVARGRVPLSVDREEAEAGFGQVPDETGGSGALTTDAPLEVMYE